MSEGEAGMMGSKENHFSQQPIGMSPVKQQQTKANNKDTGLLHRKQMRWKKTRHSLKAVKIQSVLLFFLKLNYISKEAKIGK